MTPDKIYIQSFSIDDGNTINFDDVWTEEPEPTLNNIEYLRKDALLECLKEKHATLTKQLESQDDPVLWGQRNAFQQVIDKLNRM